MTTDFRRRALALAVIALLSACARHDADAPTTAPHAAAMQASSTSSTDVTTSPWTLPVAHASQPDIATAADGSLLMSWIEQDGDLQHLRFSRWRDGRWSAPQSIAHGEGIGNGADTPHLRQTADGALWATWLHKVGTGHARDIVIARSSNNGLTWSAPVAVNTDGTATEHGFASLWPQGERSLGVAWLDGRETAGNAHGHDAHAIHAGDHGDRHAGEPDHATMLRSVVFDAQLARHDEMAVDTTTCDCCQTDVAVLADGPRLVYRDRAPGEIRDIAMLTQQGSAWSEPRRVHVDNWRMPACPVNGPAIAGDARELAVAWYTMQGEVPTVRFARSRDGGTTFDDAIDLASGADVQGRVDVALDRSGAWVAWLTEAANGQSLELAHVPMAGTSPDRRMTIATLHGRGRGTGWPRLVVTGDTLRAVWTDVRDGRPMLQAASMPLR